MQKLYEHKLKYVRDSYEQETVFTLQVVNMETDLTSAGISSRLTATVKGTDKYAARDADCLGNNDHRTVKVGFCSDN